LELKLARMCELQQLCAVAGSQLPVISFQLTAFTFCIRDDNIRLTSTACVARRSYSGFLK
jgi:hypothetical protein